MIIPSLRKGGAEKIFSFIANNLSPARFKISLIVFDGEDIQFELTNHQIEFIDLGRKRILTGVYPLMAHIKRINPDVVLSTITHLNILLCILKSFWIFFKPRLVLRESSVLSINNKSQPAYFAFLISFFYRKADAIISQSKDMTEDLIQNFNISAKMVHTINNPITSDKVGVLLRKKNEFRFLTVGRLVKSKGVHRLIEVLSRFDQQFEYVVVGDGPEFKNLEDQIRRLGLNKKVILVGEVDSVSRYYEHASLYLHGSFYEGFPNTFLEACSFGLPVICYNILGGVNEIVIDGFNGFVVNSDDDFLRAVNTSCHFSWNAKEIRDDIFLRYNKDKILSEYEKALCS